MLKDKFRKSLQFRMIAVLLIILLGTISLATAVIIKRDRDFMRNSLIEKSLALGQYAADISQEPLLLKDSLALDAIVQQVNLNDELAYSYIQDAEGQIQTNWFSSFNYAHFPGLNALLPQSTDIPEGITALKSKIPIVEVTAPITIRDNILGQVILGVSEYKIRHQINVMVYWILSINACAILVAFFLLSKWLKTITVPILGLAGLMKRVSEDKDYGARAATAGQDEIGALAQGFNEMLAQIQKRDAALDLQRQHLEEEVDGRTAELSKANVDLKQEIRERESAEAALAEETERLAVTLRSIGDGVITTDVESRIVLLNKTAEELTGWSQAEAFGKPLLEVFRIVDEKTRKPRENPAFLAIRTNSLVTLPQPTVLVGKNLTERIVADSCVPILDKNSRIIGVVLVFRDVTEARWMEDELRKSQKLESIGVLAGGIAHDFNNILSAINLNIFIIKTAAGLPEKARQRLEAAEKAVGRATDLTQQLLTFSKGGAPIKATASIPELIRESATFVIHGSDVKCVFKISDDLLLAEIDRGQISQAINNLIINAKDAMPEGGAITIAAENEMIGPGDARPLSPGAYIVIAVTDTGTGIDKDHLARIFDPYFTTKKKGSGLGLAIVFSIVKKHNGYIDVTSQPGVGTTFRMYLPASVQTVPAGVEIIKPTISGKGRILMMDDDVMISEALSEALRDLGYDVELSQDGNEAIAAYRQASESGQPFDVVIMDLTIPGGMGGKEAIKKLLSLDPQAKTIVSSGYSTDAVMANYKEHGFSGVIAKPYDISNLSRMLDALIQAPA